MVSVVISSRQPEFLQKTVDDLLTKANGEIEIIVVLDGIWTKLKQDPKIVIIHHGEVHNNYGMRASLNLGFRMAKYKYILQCDEHTMWDQGWDSKLLADMDNDWLVIPRRKRLDADRWEIISDGRPDIDYMYVEYPYLKPLDKTQGLHGTEWKRPERAEIMIDDTPTMQGSAYFFKKSHFEKLFPNGMEDSKYGTFTQEAQELSMTYWLSGGQVKVNKNTWYAHLHKGSRGKGYGFSNAQYKRHAEGAEKGRLYCISHWLYTQDYKYDMNWFVTEKFPDMPNWSSDWKERVERDKLKDYSTLKYKDDEWLEGLR